MADNMYTVTRQPLADNWNDRRRDGYDIIVVGSGYGGAITAARLATAEWPAGSKPRVCILERGKEWLPGEFPDRLQEGAPQIRSGLNPLGLYDAYFGTDIGVFKGSGLGGTSLVNANVAYPPDPEVFDDAQWPQAIRDARDSGQLQGYIERARATLFAEKHPQGMELTKVKMLQKGLGDRTNSDFELLNIAVNFQFEGANNWGVKQRKCINCGDCVTGCNVGAKNTLDTNYLAIAKWGGASIFTQVEVNRVERDAGGGYLLHYTRRESALGPKEDGTLRAHRAVILSAGALGSPAILLRSRQNGLSLADTIGTRFSGNGDFFGIAYNGDARTDDLGWGAYPDSDRARRLQPSPGVNLVPGPTIVSRIRYRKDKALKKRVTVEDLSFPLMYVDSARAVFKALIGRDTDPGFWDEIRETGRKLRDFGGLSRRLEKGALNHTLMYLVMGIDDAGGRLELNEFGRLRIDWPGAGGQSLYTKINELLLEHSTALGATFIKNPIWAFTPTQTLLTVHPIGGCPMGEDHTTGLVNDQGQVFDEQGNTHDGLYVADGSIIPTAIGVNPFLTISALSERIADGIITRLGGMPVVINQI